MIDFREIQPADNTALATLIRNALRELGADKPGTVYYDLTTDDLYACFRQQKSKYFVAVENGQILGGAGIFPSEGLPPDTTELVKMYLDRPARGRGVAKKLIQKVFEAASTFGYKRVYLETLPELFQAVIFYERFGFKRLDAPLGNIGHFGCSIWMIREV